jgi:hypothetical protein
MLLICLMRSVHATCYSHPSAAASRKLGNSRCATRMADVMRCREGGRSSERNKVQCGRNDQHRRAPRLASNGTDMAPMTSARRCSGVLGDLKSPWSGGCHSATYFTPLPRYEHALPVGVGPACSRFSIAHYQTPATLAYCLEPDLTRPSTAPHLLISQKLPARLAAGPASSEYSLSGSG